MDAWVIITYNATTDKSIDFPSAMSRLLHHHPPPPPPLAANRRPRSTVIAACKTSSILTSRSIYEIRPSFSAAYGLSRRRWPATTVICMANPRRVKMVAKQIRRELADMLLTDTVLKCAVLPEAALGADRYLSSLATISDVEVSGDLQVVHSFLRLNFTMWFLELQKYHTCPLIDRAHSNSNPN